MICELRKACAQEGFDLCEPIFTQWYNDLIEQEGHVANGTLQKISEPPIILENIGNSNDADTQIIEGGTPCSYNAVLIGNSKSIWPKFIDWLSLRYKNQTMFMEKTENHHKRCDKYDGEADHDEDDEEEILNQILNDNPLDKFVTETLSHVLRSCCSGKRNGKDIVSQLESYELYWSHGDHYKVIVDNGGSATIPTTACRESSFKLNSNKSDDYHCYAATDNSNKDKKSSFLISMQRVAKTTGKYWHDDKGTKLCIHPKFGTWKAFRAVVVFHKKEQSKPTENDSRNEHSTSINASAPKAPPMCPCPITLEEIQKAKEIMDHALTMMSTTGENNNKAETGYGGGSNSSLSSTTNELCTYLHNSVTTGSDWSQISPMMLPWIQLRDCISVGRDEYKYCDNQLLYHYTKDPEILKRELRQKM